MKEEVDMATEWRTVQFFVGMDGVAEVELDANDSDQVRCSCRKFESTSRCKHVKFVKDRIDKRSGEYNVTILAEVSPEETEAAISDYTSWRQYILKYGEIEAI